MRRRVLSILLSLMSILLIIPVFPAAAATNYSSELRSKGFPESYISALNKLKQAHSNWNFEVLEVGEDFSYSVSQERKSHSQQLIQNYSGNNGKGYYCTCSKCSKNGTPTVMELPNWVSASQKAVEYYLDPRNFLDEKYIFQFESTLYNSDQTQSGVESILNGTWMHNANITYKDKNGKSVTFKKDSKTVKYSKAIMDAAKYSDLSAYYLASKIVQEVGGTKATAGGASGTYKGYEGIYNYYNIAANTGAEDGLKWASYSPSGAHVQTSKGGPVRLRKSPVNGSIITELPSGTKVSTYEYTAKQSDGYKWVKLTNVSVTDKKYTGYIRSDYFIEGGKDTYSRPWTNPYLTIYNGAKWIADNFANQYTGYLQKFNVNPKSGSMHSHEYMANIQAAATESVKTYNAYKNNGALNSAITFSIPVFKNMPNDAPVLATPKLDTIKVNNDCSFSLSWSKITNADQYEIYHKNGDTYSYLKTVNTNSANLKNAAYGKKYTYAIKAINSKNAATPSDYSNAVSATNNIRLGTPKPTATLNEDETVTIKWSGITGADTYKISESTTTNTKWRSLETTSAKSITTKKSTKGVTYSYKVVAESSKNKDITSAESSVVSVTNYILLDAPKLDTIQVNDDCSFTLSWTQIANADQYEIYHKNGDTYSYLKTVKTNSANLKNAQYGKKYTYAIRAANSTGIAKESDYSNAVSVTNNIKLVTPKLSTIKVNNDCSFSLSWSKITGADQYEIYHKNGDTYSYLKTVKTNSANLKNATYGKEYTYAIKAINSKKAAIASDYSNAVSATNNIKLVTPKLKTIKVNNDCSFTLSWNKITGADKYEIYHKNGSSYSYLKTVKTNSATLKNATYGKKYTYAIKAIDSKGAAKSSAYSNAVSATNNKKLRTPSNVKISLNKNGTFTITWSKVTGADKYQVYMSEGGSAYKLRNTTTSNKVTTNTAAKGVTYKYKIRAVKNSKSSATSAYSSVVSKKR